MADYTWENRLLIILTDDINGLDYRNQLKELEKHNSGIMERKLLVFSASPKEYKKGISSDSEWEQSGKLYKKYKKFDSPLEVILIGLDGGVKARKREVFNTKSLFALIDGMPMRRSEMKNK